MKTLIGALLLALAVPALAQDESKAKAKSDAAKLTSGMDLGDAAKPPEKSGTADKPAKPPLDVSKMPFTTDSIKQVVAYHTDQVQQCYEEMLATLPKPVQGTLMTSWTITKDGLVKHARVDHKGSTLHNKELNECVVGVLTTMQFPKPDGGRAQQINFPFNLKAVH